MVAWENSATSVVVLADAEVCTPRLQAGGSRERRASDEGGARSEVREEDQEVNSLIVASSAWRKALDGGRRRLERGANRSPGGV